MKSSVWVFSVLLMVFKFSDSFLIPAEFSEEADVQGKRWNHHFSNARKTVKRSFTGGYFDAVNLEQKRKGAAFREEFEPPSVPVDARQANEAASVDNFPVGPVSVKIHLNIEMPSNDSVVKERLKPAKFGSRTRAWDKHNIFASSPTGKPNQKIAKRPIESRDPWSKILHREPFGHHAEVARKSEAIGYPSRRSPVTKPSQSRTAFQIISRMNDLVSLVGGIPEMSSLSNRTDEKVTSLQDPGFDDSRSKSVLKMLRSPKIETAKPTREAETPSDFSNFECRLEAKVNMITFAWPEVPSIVLNTKNSPSTLEPTLSAMPTSTETNFVTIPKLTTIKTSTSLKPMEFPIPPQFNVPSAVLHPLSPLTSIQEAPPSKDTSPDPLRFRDLLTSTSRNGFAQREEIIRTISSAEPGMNANSALARLQLLRNYIDAVTSSDYFLKRVRDDVALQRAATTISFVMQRQPRKKFYSSSD